MPAVRSRGRSDGATAQPRPDAYVGLLGLSLVALSAAMLFAFLNWNALSEKPKPVQMAAPGGGGARPAPTPAPTGAPAVNPPGIPPAGVQQGGAPANVPPPANPPQPQKQ